MLTVLAMTLGEINYVDVFVENNNYPFTVDSYILVGIFMLMMPIALVNLLVSRKNIVCNRNQQYCKSGNFRMVFILQIFYFRNISEFLNSLVSAHAVNKANSNSLLVRTLFSRGNEFANISEKD